VRAAAAKIAATLDQKGRKTAAVVDFTDLQGNVTELGRYLAEQLSVGLAMEASAFEVVDRTHLKTLLQEHKLSASGLIDPQTARKLGQIAGVETLITGSITPFGDTVSLAVKALDTDTARMVGAWSVDVPRTKVACGSGVVDQPGVGFTPEVARTNAVHASRASVTRLLGRMDLLGRPHE
jgi:curli biogenesis system outer membrane secretion channel CsgG